jgi:hypothetical protein
MVLQFEACNCCNLSKTSRKEKVVKFLVKCACTLPQVSTYMLQTLVKNFDTRQTLAMHKGTYVSS